MLQLWHCHDARSFRALWALEELGLDYDLRMLPFPPRALRKEYMAENPLGTVPLLIDGDTRMTESAAIPHYLSTVHGGGRLARAPGEAEYGAYLNWLHHGEATLTFPQTLYLRYATLEPEERRQPQVAEDYRKWFLARLRLAEQTLADGREYLLTGGFSNADISVGYAIQLALALRMRDDLPPNCLAWFDRLSARDGFTRAQAAQRAGMEAEGLKPIF
ncbi:glutathione S-transferase family protein [Aquicoccus porphyridii]|uniref:Glutathione S-transferase family protein n=1 Tax=Aquicoccus porphyridii TaxID=1852029 RepID=A0A5A9ZHT0_9RHOB|nr:glutathione S-transferase family protein [Aquicoccus porphyridii]KAA0916823.1 glutathione S-transferase family protein [Aquicoccus porphyridii]RAI53943.1 glutathione S-transferase [Rhodobacteraceae bacterium AsT-22]